MPTATIIGGSIAGLFTANALIQKGWNVTVHEKVESPLSGRGAGIATYDELADLVFKATGNNQVLGTKAKTRVSLDIKGNINSSYDYPQVYTSWQYLFSLLRNNIKNSKYFMNDDCIKIIQDDESATALFFNGKKKKSDLIIIAGRPSMGKTALATNIAFNAAQKIQESGKKSAVAFFSLEMSSEQLSTRILAEQSRIKSNDIRRGRISDEQFDKFIETSKNISELPLYIDETPAISIAAMSNRARRIKRLFGLDLIVVDYIQLMRGSGNNRDGRVQEISEITQGLKAMAKELKLPVIALSQLSRAVEQRDDHKPQLSDLRESGSIEQDADVVMFVYREAYYLERKEPRPATVEHAEWQAKMNEVSNLAELIIGKQRHGPTGNVMVEFEAMFTKFKDTQIN